MSCKPQSSWTRHSHPQGLARCERKDAVAKAVQGRERSGQTGRELRMRGPPTCSLVEGRRPRHPVGAQSRCQGPRPATRTHPPTAQPWGRLFLLSAWSCLEFIPGDHRCLFLQPYPEEPSQQWRDTGSLLHLWVGGGSISNPIALSVFYLKWAGEYILVKEPHR